MKHSYPSWLSRLALMAALGALGTTAYAQTPVNFSGAEYKENFDGFGPAGTTYPAGWSGIRLTGTPPAPETLTPLVVANNSNTGGTYNAGYNAGVANDTDRALGSLASGSTVPLFGAAFKNTSGAAIAQLRIAGRAEQWRSGSSATADESLVFEYSLDATSLATGKWTAVPALDIPEFAKTSTTAGPLDGNAAANSAVITASFPVAWAANATMWVRWKDTNDTGSDALLALDDFILTLAMAPTLPVVSFGTPTSVTVGEGAGKIQIPVTLNLISSQDVSVDVAVATAGGTATSPADYTFTTQTLTFPKGSTTTQNATLTIVDDAVVEPAETVILTLQNAKPTGGVVLGPSTYTITITDNDVPPPPTVATIASLTVNDADGVPTKKDQKVAARGTIYGTNTRTPGYLITLIDNTGGLGLFSTTNIGTVMLAEGDSVLVTGTLAQFNGLTQITLDEVTPLGRAKRTYQPRALTTVLTENEESELIRIPGPLTVDDPAQWTTTATGTGYNVDVTGPNGVRYDVRILRGTTLYNRPAPTGKFSLTGIGTQFDPSLPYTEGYQIIPRGLGDLVLGQREPAFAKSVLLYPNPTTGHLIVVAGSAASVEVFNALGQLVQEATVTGTQANLDVTSLKVGLYFVRLTTKEGSVSRTFVKQ